MAPRGHPSEGQIDSYYALTATVDFFGVGRRRLEAPVEVLVLPTLVLAAFAWIRGSAPPGQRIRRALGAFSIDELIRWGRRRGGP